MTRRELDTMLIQHSKGAMYHFHRMVEGIFGLFGLTPPQGAVLGILYEQGEQPITGLSQQLHVTKGALSTLCKRMEAQGLLTRRRSKEDERFVYISITPKSSAILQTLNELRQRFYESRPEAVEGIAGAEACALLREEQLQ